MADDWQGLDSNAVWHRQKGNLKEAAKLMADAISVAVRAGVSQQRLATMGNYLADVHLENNDYDAAEIVIREAIARSESLQNICLADNLLILAEILARKGNYDNALITATRAGEVFKLNEHPHGANRASEVVKAIAAEQAV